MIFNLEDKVVAYGEYYITNRNSEWYVTKSGRDKSVLFSGTYDECINYCKSLKNKSTNT